MNEDNLDDTVKIYKVITIQKPPSTTNSSTSSPYYRSTSSTSLRCASFLFREVGNGTETGIEDAQGHKGL